MIVLCIYVALIIIYGLFKKVNCYDSFEKGVKENYSILKNIFPNMLGLVFAVEVFINSGIIELITPCLSIINIVPEIILQMLMRPLSSSSALILMTKIFTTYGVNSFNGITSSIIQGSSDTTFYVLVLYFSSVSITNTKYALKVGLLTDFLTFVIVYLLCLIFI